MGEVELAVVSGDAELPATLTLPDGPARAGLVTLHPASMPQRDCFLFTHLASLLRPRGFAVLSYDRRASTGFDDVPFEHQADDALAAVAILRGQIGAGPPIGLWAFSQGAWAAPLAASKTAEVAFLILVGAPGVSPAEQMRFSAVEALRRSGRSSEEIERAVAARAAIEAALRGQGTLEVAQRALDRVGEEPWFDLLQLPRTLPAVGPEDATWTDMDFDPAPVFRHVRCPVLLVYGDDEVVPVEPSVRVWRESAAVSCASLDIVLLSRSTHVPTIDETDTVDAVDPDYEQALLSWLDDLLPVHA